MLRGKKSGQPLATLVSLCGRWKEAELRSGRKASMACSRLFWSSSIKVTCRVGAGGRPGFRGWHYSSWKPSVWGQRDSMITAWAMPLTLSSHWVRCKCQDFTSVLGSGRNIWYYDNFRLCPTLAHTAGSQWKFCVCVCMCLYMCMCINQRSSKPQGSSCPLLLSSGITRGTWLLMWILGNWIHHLSLLPRPTAVGNLMS